MKTLRMLFCALLVAAALCAAATAEVAPGDAMPDFSAMAADGRETTLSGLLDNHDMVLICLLPSPNEIEAPILPDEDRIGTLLLRFDEPEGAALAEALGVTVPPACAVVDRFGTLCYLGPVPDSEALFAQLTEPLLATDYAESVPLSAYAVRFADQNGNPVADVLCQVCDEFSCSLYSSDADGACAFILPSRDYEIHILRAPDGYAFDDVAASVPASGGETAFLLERQ